jgi:dihydroxyacetone kinase
LPGEAAKTETAIRNEIEIGLGIHGEPGRKRVEMSKSKQLVESVLAEFDLFTSKNICFMVNNLGGLSNLELYLLANDCFQYLATHRPDIRVARLYCGTLMTSLNMNGFSLTAFSLDNDRGDTLLELLDASTSAPAWPRQCGRDVEQFEYTQAPAVSHVQASSQNLSKYVRFSSAASSELFKLTLRGISEDLIDARDGLNELDAACGDGDCGNSLARIGQAILDNESRFDFDYPHQVLTELSAILENGGGSLCIILSLFMSGAVSSFQKQSPDSGSELFWIDRWREVVDSGLKVVQEYGRAKPNQRSIVDPLTAMSKYLADFVAVNSKSAQVDVRAFLKGLVDETHRSAEATAHMKPGVGRASYVDSALINKPDAGAKGISSIVNSIYKAWLLSNNQ